MLRFFTHATLRTARHECTGITMTILSSRLVTHDEDKFISFDLYGINDIDEAANVTMLLTCCNTGDASRREIRKEPELVDK